MLKETKLVKTESKMVVTRVWGWGYKRDVVEGTGLQLVVNKSYVSDAQYSEYR